MGKYMRKAKTTSDVALMDSSQSSLGVRTRARTLALQRLQPSLVDDAARPGENSDLYYLELRSRRLEKPHLQMLNAREDMVRARCGCRGKEPLENRTREECCGVAYFSCSIEGGGLEIEASFGENDLDAETMERETRECTPCSSTMAAFTPGTTTKHTRSSAGINEMVPLTALFVDVPTQIELEDFFAFEEQSLQQHLREKYNFDFVNDSPLAGRYEWVKVMNP